MSDSQRGVAKERVALFGGAFDPFHNGHIAAIRLLLRAPEIDTVLVVPSGDRPDKKNVSAAHHRLEMAKLGVASAFAGDPRVAVSDLHSEGIVGYGTIDLIAYFEGDPVKDCVVVIGQELLPDLCSWKDADALRSRARFLVMRRPGAPTTEIPQGWKISFLDPFGDEGISLSSTELRQKLNRGENCEGLMPPSVASYCKAQHLYER